MTYGYESISTKWCDKHPPVPKQWWKRPFRRWLHSYSFDPRRQCDCEGVQIRFPNITVLEELATMQRNWAAECQKCGDGRSSQDEESINAWAARHSTQEDHLVNVYRVYRIPMNGSQ